MTDQSLSLPDRTGLPDGIAYLRAAHPQPTWRSHRNFGELTAFWLQVHAGLRAHGSGVVATLDDLRGGADPAAFRQTFVPRINQFLQHLDQHHRIEDAAYFPKFRALDPRMVAGFDLLEHDHEVIHDALSATVTSARALLAALSEPADTLRRAADAHALDAGNLVRLLHRHLADEEDLVVPALLEHGERSVG